MKRNMVKAMLLGTIAGFLCIIAPNGSYNNTPVAIYQHPFNITVFYLIYIALQSDNPLDIEHHCDYVLKVNNFSVSVC